MVVAMVAVMVVDMAKVGMVAVMAVDMAAAMVVDMAKVGMVAAIKY
jgi:hypothetical protein